MSKNVFNIYSRYYDLIYRDKDYFSEAAYIKALLGRYDLSEGDLLEFGSGTGKHGCILAGHGFRVHGIELSADMVTKAEVAPGFTCQQGDIASTIMGRKYDAVLSLFHVISYQTSNAQLRAVLKNASAHLHPNGLFVFDFWYSPAVCSQKPTVRIKRVSDAETEIVRIAEPVIYANENRVDVHYTVYIRNLKTNEVRTVEESHSMRHFSLPEINFLAETYGFQIVVAEEFLSGREPGESTWGVCVALQKVGHD